MAELEPAGQVQMQSLWEDTDIVPLVEGPQGHI